MKVCSFSKKCCGVLILDSAWQKVFVTFWIGQLVINLILLKKISAVVWKV